MSTRNGHQKSVLKHVETLRETLSTSIIVCWIPLMKSYWNSVPFRNTSLVMNFSLFKHLNYLYKMLYAHCENITTFQYSILTFYSFEKISSPLSSINILWYLIFLSKFCSQQPCIFRETLIIGAWIKITKLCLLSILLNESVCAPYFCYGLI